MAGYAEYAAAEIDNLAGAWASAERRYLEALRRARQTGATFLAGVSSVGLVSVLAARGAVRDALSGYADLLDYWERTGGWTQQWTTLRNLATLLDTLGDHDAARAIRRAADLAPEAAATGPDAPRPSRDQHRREDRRHVLALARSAIALHGDRRQRGSPTSSLFGTLTEG